MKEHSKPFGYRIVELAYLEDLGSLVGLPFRERLRATLAFAFFYIALLAFGLSISYLGLAGEAFRVTAILISAVTLGTVLAGSVIIMLPEHERLHIAVTGLIFLIAFVLGAWFGAKIGIVFADDARDLNIRPEFTITFFAWIASLLLMQLGIRFFNKVARSIQTEKLKHENELKLGNQIQQQLLPVIDQQIGRYQIYGKSWLASEVSGDFFDVWSDQKRIVAIAGDVSGHGVAAGLLVSSLKAIFLSGLKHGDRLGDVIRDMNSFMRETSAKGMFASVAAVEISRENNIATIVNAGHLPVLYHHSDHSVEQHKPAGFALGMSDDLKLEGIQLILHENDELVLITDGLVEQKDDERQEFGMRRIRDVIVKTSTDVGHKAESIFGSAMRFSGKSTPDDDCTIVLLKSVADYLGD